MPNMMIAAMVVTCLAGTVFGVPLDQLQPRQANASATGVAQTGQAQTVTGFVPTSLPSLVYYALPGPDTVPNLLGTGLATVTSAGAISTKTVNAVIIQNVDIIPGDDTTKASEFLDLDASGNLQDAAICKAINGTAADCIIYIYNQANATNSTAEAAPSNSFGVANFYETTIGISSVTLTAAAFTALAGTAVPAGLSSAISASTAAPLSVTALPSGSAAALPSATTSASLVSTAASSAATVVGAASSLVASASV